MNWIRGVVVHESRKPPPLPSCSWDGHCDHTLLISYINRSLSTTNLTKLEHLQMGGVLEYKGFSVVAPGEMTTPTSMEGVNKEDTDSVGVDAT